MRVALLAYDDCLTSVVSGLIDTFALASVASQRLRPASSTVFSTSVVTASGRPVVGSGGFVIAPSASLRQLKHYDVVVVPPMAAAISEVIARETRLIGWLRRAHGRGPLLCSVCTGSFMLAEAGLLDGKRATTNAWYGDELQRGYPQVDVQTESRIVDERTVISAGTTTAFLDLAIYLVDKFGGKGCVSAGMITTIVSIPGGSTAAVGCSRSRTRSRLTMRMQRPLVADCAALSSDCGG